MHRFVFLALCLFATACLSVAPARAAGSPSHQQHPVDWQARDTAIYVVSTVNLLHTKDGQPLSAIFANRLGVTQYQVFADTDVKDLYFIKLRRDNGRFSGALAYQMGWQTPRSLSRSTDRLGVRHADGAIVNAFHTDSKELLGTFTSTLPQ